MLFNAPSPKGTNRAQLYLDQHGQLLDRHGNFWGTSQIAKLPKMARDELPAHLTSGSGEKTAEEIAEEKVREVIGAVEKTMEHLDLNPSVQRAFYKCLEPHRPRSGPNADLKRAGAKDAGRKGRPARDNELEEYFRGRGLKDEEIEQALELVRRHREAEAKDKLPVNALRGGSGGALSGASKESFEQKYPEAAGVVRGFGYSQFDRDLPQAHDGKSKTHLERKLPDIVLPEVGEWPRRVFPR